MPKLAASVYADERARAFPFFVVMGPISFVYLATFSIGSQPALMDAGPPGSCGGSSYTCTTLSALTSSRFRERANKFFGLVAERRRALRQMVVAPGELLLGHASVIFIIEWENDERVVDTIQPRPSVYWGCMCRDILIVLAI